MVAEKVIDDLDPGWALTRKAGSVSRRYLIELGW